MANLRKKEIMNGLVGPKNPGRGDQPKEKKRETNRLVGSKTRGGVGQPK